MNRVRKSIRQVSLWILAVTAAFAIGLVPNLIAQEAPPPMPDGAKKFQAFVGSWEGTGSMTMNGQTQQVNISHTTESIAGGWGTRTIETVKMPEMPTYSGVDMFGFDIGSGLTHLYTVSNYGDCHDHVGTWVDNKTLVLQYNGVLDGKPMVEMLTVVVDSPTQYHYTGQTYIAGSLVYTNKATMTRK